MLRGLHDTFVPMLFALFGYWVIGIGVGAWLAFERDWGGVGIWTGLATCLSIVAVLMLTRRSEEHTSELQSLMRISYAVFCLKKNNLMNVHSRPPLIAL